MPGNGTVVTGGGGENGSGYIIGDNHILTAGHVVFEWDRIVVNPGFDTGSLSIALDFRSYRKQYESIVSVLSSPLPTNPVIDGHPLIAKNDSVVINKRSTSSIGPGDDGLVLFLDPTDLTKTTSMDFFGSTTSVVRSDKSGTNNGTILKVDPISNPPIGSIWDAFRGTVLQNNILFSSGSISGDSGGAYLFRVEGKEFVLGTHYANSANALGVVVGSLGTYFSASEFNAINNMLEIATDGNENLKQTGNVTDDEPTNLIVGSMSSDGLDSAPIKGSYRADIILGRGGNDVLSDGDDAFDFVYADDQLYGGAGDDILIVGDGHNLIHGGDFRDYSGNGRLELAADGTDTADFGGVSSGIEIRFPAPDAGDAANADNAQIDRRYESILSNNNNNDFKKAFFVTTRESVSSSAPRSTNTLVSIEKIKGTEAADILFISDLSGGIPIQEIDFGNSRESLFEPILYDADLIQFSQELTTGEVNGVTSGVTVDLSNPENQTIAGYNLLIKNAENVIGTQANDNLIAVNKGANAAGSVLLGAGGNDVLTGSSSFNTLIGGEGNDTIHLKSGDFAIGGSGSDTFYVTTTVAEGDIYKNNVFILDFDPDEDTLYVNGNQFDGYNKKVTFTKFTERDVPNGDFGPLWVQEVSGTSSYGLIHLRPKFQSFEAVYDHGGSPYFNGRYRDVTVANIDQDGFDFGRVQFLDTNIVWKDPDPEGPPRVPGLPIIESALTTEFLNIYTGKLWSGDNNFFKQEIDYQGEGDGTDRPLGQFSILDGEGLEVRVGHLALGETVASPPSVVNTVALGFDSDLDRFSILDWNNNAPGAARVLLAANNNPLSINRAASTSGPSSRSGQDSAPSAFSSRGPSSEITFIYDRYLQVTLPISASDVSYVAHQSLLKGTDLSRAAITTIGGMISLNELGIVPDNSELLRTEENPGLVKFGSAADETLSGHNGNDVLIGNGGNDTITLTGFRLNDIDLISGGAGDDVYSISNAPGSFDKIVITERLDQNDAAGGFDVLNINVASTEVIVVDGNSPTDLRILIPDSENPRFGIINLINQLGTNPDDWIEEIRFSDGVIWTRNQLIAAAVAPDPILAGTLPAVTVAEDSEIHFSISSAFIDTYRRDFEYSSTLANGDPLPQWLSVSDGNVIGTPPPNFNGQLEITITGAIGNESVTTNLSLTVSPVNDAPELENPLASVFLTQGNLVDILVPLDTFLDVDGDALTLAATLADGQPLPAWLAFDGTRFTGTPPQDFIGFLELAVTASDGLLDVTDSFVLFFEESTNGAPTVSLTLANRSVAEDSAIDIFVPLDTFTDPDGDNLTLSAALSNGSPLPAWLVFDASRLTGNPPQDFNGALELSITASDGEFEVSENFVLTIDPVNDAPVLSLMFSDQTSLEDQAIDFAVPAGTFTDIDEDALTLSATLADGTGLPAWLNFDGERFTGQPPQDFNGLVEIELTASDGILTASDLFALSITPVNDPPVVLIPLADVSGLEDTAINIDIPLDTFVDVDGDLLTLSASLSDGSPLPAWLTFNGTQITGTPPQDFNGIINLAITASDGTLDIVDNFVFTIDPVNDTPVVLNPIADANSPEDRMVNIALPTNVFSDIDGDTLTLSAVMNDGSSLPAWLSFDGVRFTGVPPQDFNGNLAIRVTASDGAQQTSNDFNLVIDAVNDAPVIDLLLADHSSDEDQAVSFILPAGAFTDVDSDLLTLSAKLIDGTDLPTWLQFDGSGFTGIPPQNFDGSLEIAVNASDGSLSTSQNFTLTIKPVNDAPVAVDDDIFLSEGGDQLTILQSSLLLNDTDVDGDTLTVTAVTNGTNGTVGFDADGNIVYTPNAGFQGTDSFTYTVSDGTLTSTATAQLRVENPFSGWRQGSEGNDWLFGNFFSTNEIFGRGGNDRIFGGFRTDYLAGGDGNDDIFGLFDNDHLWGNAGDDRLYGGFGTDTAYFSGKSSDYELQTQFGGFYVRIRDELPNVNGDDGRDQLYSIEKLAFTDTTISVASPIILDLDGDGTEVVSAGQSAALFDLDNDGVRDDTSWIGSGDAFLFLDRDGDGTVSGVQEISFIDDVEGARSDLDGLRSFDSNGDGILSSADARYTDFGVWQDLDTDGEVDAGEILTLAEAGIVSINLNASPTDAGFRMGDVAIVNRGSFLRSDGTSSDYVDAAITFFEKGAPELPKIAFDSSNYDRKSMKYRLYSQNGELMIGDKRGATESLAGASILRFKNRSLGLLSPVVLDLDGNGVHLIDGAKSGAWFDMDSDGRADDSGWISRGDGFLVVDRNNNGIIDNGSELSFLAESPNAKSDLQALTAFDSNGDGIISAQDVRFSELKIWVDRNSNGSTDTGELQSLADHGIASVNLQGQSTNERVKLGKNIILANSTFIRTNGTIGQVGDAVLSFTPSAGQYSFKQNNSGRSWISRNQATVETGLLISVDGGFEEPDLSSAQFPELAALRAGLGSSPIKRTGQGLSFGVPTASNVFEYYQQEQSLLPLANTSVDMTSSEMSATDDNPLIQSLHSGSRQERTGDHLYGTEMMDSDAHKLALITQDMGMFGARSAVTSTKLRERHVPMMDYLLG